jgi:hypothetical protein
VLSDCVVARELYNRIEVARYVFPAQRLVHNWHAVTLNEEQTIDLRNGVPLTLAQETGQARCVALDSKGDLVGLMQATQVPEVFRSIRVFHAENAACQPRKIKAKHRPES